MAYTRVQYRRGTEAEWNTNNPILAPGEPALNLTNGKIKIGNGSTAWAELEYFAETAYELAVRLGFTGTEQEWLNSLSGYAIAVENGFTGTQEEWLLSLVGPPANISTGTVTTGDPGSQASVSISGTAPDYTIDFTIPQGIEGIQGIQGETGPIGPTGATGIEWRGEWDSSTDYVDNDAVFYQGASWFASGDPDIGEEPTELSVHWYPLALQGATGPQGLQGIQGEQGIQGPIGPVGPGLSILGSFVSFEALEAAVTNPNTGDAYTVNGDLYTWNGTSWINVGPIVTSIDSPLPLIFATGL